MADRHTRILVVDDEEAKRYIAAHVLRKAGFEVVEAASGEEALRLAATGLDLIILDVNLPDIDGFEVCRRIKSDPATATIPVLQISARFVSSADRVQGLETGADGYLAESVDPPELIATVRSLLRIREAEEAARASARQWQATFDAINDAVCLVDREGNWVRANRAMVALFGGAPGPGDPSAALGAAPDALKLLELLPLAGLPEPQQRLSMELQLGDRWFSVTADTVIDAQQQAAGAVYILSDITERRRLEDQLRQRAADLAEADRRKDEFLAMLAHELRNPLTPIRNAVHVMRERGSDAATRERLGGVVERQVQHMTHLIDDLLDVSRITRGMIQLRSARVDLSALVRQSAEDHRAALELGGLKLDMEVPEGPLWVMGDATRLSQILDNLLHNAAKFTDPGGQVTLRLGRDPTGTRAALTVADTGIGISPVMLPHVFETFAQADRSLDRSRGGLGLGLALVKGLVELHGGEVRAGSEGLGRGAEVTLLLPLADSAAEETPGDARAIPSPGARRVLVVEDLADAAETLREMLELFGHAVEVARSGPEAVEIAGRFAPEVVFCDIGLPGMDGYAVAAALRQNPGTAGAHLVALSGYGQEDDRRRSREAGFDVHLTKPVDVEELQRQLGNVK